jgi:hypothetical protein
VQSESACQRNGCTVISDGRHPRNATRDWRNLCKIVVPLLRRTGGLGCGQSIRLLLPSACGEKSRDIPLPNSRARTRGLRYSTQIGVHALCLRSECAAVHWWSPNSDHSSDWPAIGWYHRSGLALSQRTISIRNLEIFGGQRLVEVQTEIAKD